MKNASISVGKTRFQKNFTGSIFSILQFLLLPKGYGSENPSMWKYETGKVASILVFVMIKIFIILVTETFKSSHPSEKELMQLLPTIILFIFSIAVLLILGKEPGSISEFVHKPLYYLE